MSNQYSTGNARSMLFDVSYSAIKPYAFTHLCVDIVHDYAASQIALHGYPPCQQQLAQWNDNA